MEDLLNYSLKVVVLVFTCAWEKLSINLPQLERNVWQAMKSIRTQ